MKVYQKVLLSIVCAAALCNCTVPVQQENRADETIKKGVEETDADRVRAFIEENMTIANINNNFVVKGGVVMNDELQLLEAQLEEQSKIKGLPKDEANQIKENLEIQI